MSRYVARRGAVLLVVLAALALALVARFKTGPTPLLIGVDRDRLPADGYAEAHLHGKANGLIWHIQDGSHLGRLAVIGSEARFRAGVRPGLVTLVAAAPGYLPTRVEIELGLDPSDQFGDGTPDFLRLESQRDQIAFRRWFAFLAESTYFQSAPERPTEITDCAALIRFAYREALRKHDAAWANHWHLSQLPKADSVGKYDYPHTPVGAGLFRTKPGAFTPEELSNGTFAEFGDADTLRRYNTHFISRDIHAAHLGDLLCFRQQGHRMPFHVMVYLGPSSFTPGTDWLIYHTGPVSDGSSEIRRITVMELLQHPQFSWRPLPQNPAFLGIYRWNILREQD
ncbi:MAG: DUF1175 family protein [Acidobacteria bacterium]|nr:DUF1175 family protein [Acidobacteriota bacterium]